MEYVPNCSFRSKSASHLISQGASANSKLGGVGAVQTVHTVCTDHPRLPTPPLCLLPLNPFVSKNGSLFTYQNPKNETIFSFTKNLEMEAC